MGNAWISYVIAVPTHGTPEFSFNYRLYSYDEIVAGREDEFDKFDVYIDDLSDPRQPFRILRTGSDNGWPPSGSSYPCNRLDATDWMTATWKLSSVQNFDNPNQVYDLRGKTIEVIFKVFSQEVVGTSGWYNTWVFIDNLKLQPEISLTKSANPPGPLHEGDLITYTIAYANTGLTTQTITITDQIPFNVTLEPGTITPPGYSQGSQFIWPIGPTAPGQSGQVSFAVRVPLLPSLSQLSTSSNPPPLPPPGSPAYVLPVPVSCDTTRFWANGVTVQPPPAGVYTLHVQIPPGANPSEMWLMMKGINHPPPMVEEQPAQQVMTSTGSFSASLWSAPLTSPMTADNQATIITQNPRELNAIFLFDQNDPPFDKTTLEDFYQTTKTFTYTFDIPSVMTRTMAVIMPVLDITYLTDSTPPQVDTRLTTITMEFGDQHHSVVVNNPNMGNGLLMTQFPFDIGRIPGASHSIKTLTITVDTEDSVYTLGPRVCRPVYIENTAWLCSDRAGCISATATNPPENFIPPNTVYLPIILKPNPH